MHDEARVQLLEIARVQLYAKAGLFLSVEDCALR